MYSHRPDHSRQYNERRHRDPSDEHWEMHETQRNCHRKYGGSMERTSRSREYSDSPRRQYSKDSVNREKRQKIPLRTRVSSPDWDPSEKKRRRLTEDEEHYKYRDLAEVKTSRQLSLDSAYSQPSADFHHEEECESQKRTRSSRHGHHHEEFEHRRPYGDDHERTWGCPPTRTQTQDDSLKNQNRDVSHQNARPDENKSSKGFQRFLDVLNKGVNVATLTKILTSVKEDDQPRSLTSHLGTKAQPSSPRSAGMEQKSGPNPNRRSEDVDFWRTASSESPRESLSIPKESCRPDEPTLQSCDGDQSYLSSGSLTRLDKIALTPEEEHKHKQAQHVLQAIGMNIEFEELGQMSHRIQERLYGKKDGDRGRLTRHSRRGDPIGGLSPELRHRSSTSSRSTCSPSPEKSKKDSHSFQPGKSEKQRQMQVHHSFKYGQKSSSEQESTDSDVQSWENLFAYQTYSQNLAYTLPESRPVPVMPVCSPASDPRLPFPAPLPNLAQPGPPLCFPPVPPYPHPLPVSVFPAMLAQMQPLFPPPFANPLVPPSTPPQKPKPLSRPRCLQVIETKQPS